MPTSQFYVQVQQQAEFFALEFFYESTLNDEYIIFKYKIHVISTKYLISYLGHKIGN